MTTYYYLQPTIHVLAVQSLMIPLLPTPPPINDGGDQAFSGDIRLLRALGRRVNNLGLF